MLCIRNNGRETEAQGGSRHALCALPELQERPRI